jgi:hypothetical protein
MAHDIGLLKKSYLYKPNSVVGVKSSRSCKYENNGQISIMFVLLNLWGAFRVLGVAEVAHMEVMAGLLCSDCYTFHCKL